MPHLTLHITTTNKEQLFKEVVAFIDDNKLGEVMWSTEEGNEVMMGGGITVKHLF